MQLKRVVKKTFLKLGLYPLARRIARKFDQRVQNVIAAEKSLYDAFIKPGDLVFDIGVNVGQKSEIFLSRSARVLGVEPNPLCKAVILYQFGQNPDFTLVEKALGKQAGRAVLNFVGTDATASLRADWPYISTDHSPIAQAEVEVTTLDILIAEFGRPRLCKIDVEGFEFEVISGLSQPIPYISFEYHMAESQQFLKCLAHIHSLSRIEININEMNHGDFFFGKWLSYQEFIEEFERSNLPEKGDCWVRATVTLSA